MEKKIALSIEQMKYLEELGFDTSDASMYYSIFKKENESFCVLNINTLNRELPKRDNQIPAYTLQDILEKYFYDTQVILFPTDGTGGWKCQHIYSNHIEFNISPLSCSYQMLIWCIENNYIKTNKV